MDTCKSVGVAASLAAAGLGITLLPVRCYRNDIAARRLRIVKTEPPMRPVEFNATYASDNLQPIVRAIADLAAEVSDFTSTLTRD